MIARWTAWRRAKTLLILWIVVPILVGIGTWTRDTFVSAWLISSAGCLSYWLWWNRSENSKYKTETQNFQQRASVLILQPPLDSTWTPKQTLSFWSQCVQLLRGTQYIQMGIAGSKESVSYYLVARNEQDAKTISHQLKGNFVGLQVVQKPFDDPKLPFLFPDDWHIMEIALRERQWQSPLISYAPNPLSPLLSDIAHLEGDEFTAGVYVNARSGFEAKQQARQQRQKLLFPDTNNGKQRPLNSVQKDRLSQLGERAENPMAEVQFVVWCASKRADRATTTADRLAKHVITQFVGDNQLRPYTITGKPLYQGKPKARQGGVSFAYGRYDGVPASHNDLALMMQIVNGTALSVAPIRTADLSQTPDHGQVSADQIGHILEGLR